MVETVAQGERGVLTHGRAIHWLQVEAALEGFCELVEASDLVSELRAVKSPAELVYVRKAAQLGDLALDEAIRLARPGAFEGDILVPRHSDYDSLQVSG